MTKWAKVTEYIMGWDADGAAPYINLYGEDGSVSSVWLTVAEDMYEIEYVLQKGECWVETEQGALWVKVYFAAGADEKPGNVEGTTGIRVDNVVFYTGKFAYSDGSVTSTPKSSYTINLCNKKSESFSVKSPSAFSSIRVLLDMEDAGKPHYFFLEFKQIETSRKVCPQRGGS